MDQPCKYLQKFLEITFSIFREKGFLFVVFADDSYLQEMIMRNTSLML